MTDEEIDLPRRLVLHPRWRWQNGMRAVALGLVTEARDEWIVAGGCLMRVRDMPPPHIDSPETQGWLLSMLRDAINDGLTTMELWMEPTDGKKSVIVTIKPIGETPYGPWASTLGEALARALLTAWGEPSGSAG
jgi:hypothetical protein